MKLGDYLKFVVDVNDGNKRQFGEYTDAIVGFSKWWVSIAMQLRRA